MAKLTVRRKGYVRSPYERKGFCYTKRGKKICVSPAKVERTKVPPTTFQITDIGAIGRSEKPRGVPKLKKGRMSREVRKILKKEISPSQLTKKQWGKVFRKSKIPSKSWLGMFGTQIARRKYAKKGSLQYQDKLAFQKAIDMLSEIKNLTPREAITKWKSLPHAVRARLMPERSKKNLKNVI